VEMLKRRSYGKKSDKRVDRKRASRACSSCRFRKVRCDLLITGSPCTSCRLYGMSCSIPTDRRLKSTKDPVLELNPKDVIDGSRKNAQDAGNLELPESVRLSRYFPAKTTQALNLRQTKLPDDQNLQYWVDSPRRPEGADYDQLATRKKTGDWKIWLPNYAAPLSQSITREDYKRLHGEGAFIVPENSIRNELLRSYIQFVHPTIPVLDLEQFLMAVDGTSNEVEGVSFLVFQAVMFAATAFETPASVKAEKSQNRETLRATRYSRIYALYIAGCEENRLAILQTFLLMTSWDGSNQGSPCARSCIGIAKAIFQSIQMSPTDAETQTLHRKPGLWKSIEWTLYIRDRLVALLTNSPFQVEESIFRSPMLQTFDLQAGPLSTKSCLAKTKIHPAIRDPFLGGLMAEVTINIAKLCKWISRVLPCQPRNPSKDYIPSLNHSSSGAEVLLRDMELMAWKNSLPKLLQLRFSSPIRGVGKHEDVLLVFRVMLDGLYNLASYRLHQPRLYLMHFDLPEVLDISQHRTLSAVSGMTDTYQFLCSNGPPDMFPEGLVRLLETSIKFHLSDFASSIPSTRKSAVMNFQLCAEGLQKLGETYPLANRVLAGLDASVSNTGDLVSHTGGFTMPASDAETVYRPASERYAEKRVSYDGSSDSTGTTLSQTIGNLDVSQTSSLLSSHFMMTSSERTLLLDLASPAMTTSTSNVESLSDTSSPVASTASVDGPFSYWDVFVNSEMCCKDDFPEIPSRAEDLDSTSASYGPQKSSYLDIETEEEGDEEMRLDIFQYRAGPLK